MTSQSLVARLAKIIDPEAFGLPLDNFGSDYLSDRDMAREKARAVIAAMREPTEAMAWVGRGTNHADLWRAMIDAALSEKPPER